MDDREYRIMGYLYDNPNVEFSKLDNALTGYFDNSKEGNIYAFTSKMEWMGLFHENKGKYIELSEKGKEIYLNELSIRNEQRREKELQILKLRYDVKISERIYKTYFSTRTMAIIACIVSVCLLVIKVAEVLKILP